MRGRVLARFKCNHCQTYNPPIVNGDECGVCVAMHEEVAGDLHRAEVERQTQPLHPWDDAE